MVAMTTHAAVVPAAAIKFLFYVFVLLFFLDFLIYSYISNLGINSC